MQNISHVMSLMGRTWVSGLRPAKNVGTNIIEQIERIILEQENTQSEPRAAFDAKVDALRKSGPLSKPTGNRKPTKSVTQTTTFNRDPKVVAWVLEASEGVCEACNQNAPFIKINGVPFLEVHHLRTLADGGSDTISNAIAVCPNCHREIHFGDKKNEILEQVYSALPRLVKE